MFLNTFCYFCTQNDKLMTTGQQLHPIFYIGEQIERDGLMVIDVTSQPLDGAPYISPYAVVALCEQGTAYSEYDMMPVEFHPHDLTIMHQGHIVSARSTSPDYRARLIAMSEDFFEKLKHQNFQRFGQQSLYYEENPHFHLNDEQYRYIKASFDLLEGVSKIGRRYKEELFLSIFSALLLGFGEQASFSRFFKNNTGMTPSQYRESSWTGDEQNAL